MCGLFHSPAVPPGLSMHECGIAGSASSCTACPVHSTILHLSGSGPPGLSMRECGATGSAGSHTACSVCSTVHHGSGSSCVAESSLPQLPVYTPPTSLDECCFFISSGCWTFVQFNFLSVLVVLLSLNCCPSFVVRGGAVCLPTPPSWFSQNHGIQ